MAAILDAILNFSNCSRLTTCHQAVSENINPWLPKSTVKKNLIQQCMVNPLCSWTINILSGCEGLNRTATSRSLDNQCLSYNVSLCPVHVHYQPTLCRRWVCSSQTLPLFCRGSPWPRPTNCLPSWQTSASSPTRRTHWCYGRPTTLTWPVTSSPATSPLKPRLHVSLVSISLYPDL